MRPHPIGFGMHCSPCAMHSTWQQAGRAPRCPGDVGLEGLGQIDRGYLVQIGRLHQALPLAYFQQCTAS